MGGFFGVASKHDCSLDVFYGTDFHSHLGTRRGGMAAYTENGFNRAIHNIQNSPFRTKLEHDVEDMKGNLAIGSISDYEPQPLLISSPLGSFAIATVGKVNNMDQLLKILYRASHCHFSEMSGGLISPTEVVAALISERDSIVDGLRYVQSLIEGSMSILLMTKEGLYASRDLYGRTPIMIGHKEDAFCVSFESFAYVNLGYEDYKELGPGEIVYVTAEGVETLSAPCKKMKICSFLWAYYGYPTSSYEGVNVEEMRYNCGKLLAQRDKGLIEPDMVAGVPDSGLAHAIGYANESGVPYARPFIKYTPTWSRSFMPTNQAQRNLVARMKLIPVKSLIDSRKLLLIDDSIVRGTQLRETTEFLYNSGAKEVHVRPACPPFMFGCKFLNFSRSNSEMELITRRVIRSLEGENDSNVLDEYTNPNTDRYDRMLEEIRKQQNFTSLRYHRLDDFVKSIGLDACQLCTYCFDGKE